MWISCIAEVRTLHRKVNPQQSTVGKKHWELWEQPWRVVVLMWWGGARRWQRPNPLSVYNLSLWSWATQASQKGVAWQFAKAICAGRARQISSLGDYQPLSSGSSHCSGGLSSSKDWDLIMVSTRRKARVSAPVRKDIEILTEFGGNHEAVQASGCVEFMMLSVASWGSTQNSCVSR